MVLGTLRCSQTTRCANSGILNKKYNYFINLVIKMFFDCPKPIMKKANSYNDTLNTFSSPVTSALETF